MKACHPFGGLEVDPPEQSSMMRVVYRSLCAVISHTFMKRNQAWVKAIKSKICVFMVKFQTLKSLQTMSD